MDQQVQKNKVTYSSGNGFNFHIIRRTLLSMNLKRYPIAKKSRIPNTYSLHSKTRNKIWQNKTSTKFARQKLADIVTYTLTQAVIKKNKNKN